MGLDAQPTVLAKVDGRDIEATLRQTLAQVASAEQAQAVATAQLAAAEAQQQAAEAQVTAARTGFKRMKTLYAQKAAMGQQMDHARSQRDVAEAQTQAAAQQVNAVRSETARGPDLGPLGLDPLHLRRHPHDLLHGVCQAV
jgi:multidrug resistance efflux pump